MISKTITFTDFNGQEQKEELFFNFSKAELIEMQYSSKDGLDKQLERIVKENNAAEIIKMLKTIISKSYGIKSDDGKRFIKSEEITNDFLNSAAYDELFMQLANNPDVSMEFILGVLPADIASQIKKTQANGQKIENVKN